MGSGGGLLVCAATSARMHDLECLFARLASPRIRLVLVDQAQGLGDLVRCHLLVNDLEGPRRAATRRRMAAFSRRQLLPVRRRVTAFPVGHMALLETGPGHSQRRRHGCHDGHHRKQVSALERGSSELNRSCPCHLSDLPGVMQTSSIISPHDALR